MALPMGDADGTLRVACLVSGGKDGHYAHHLAARDHEVVALANLVPSERDAWMLHSVAQEIVPLQAECLGLPLRRARAGAGEDAELAGIRKLLAELEVDGIVTGGRRSRYQQSRFDRIADDLGLEAVHPLWGLEAGSVLEAMAEDWDVRIAAVAAEGLDASWLDRRLDTDALQELFDLADDHGFHRDGEGGGFETAVLDGPGFDGRIDWAVEAVWEGSRGYIRVNEARIVR